MWNYKELVLCVIMYKMKSSNKNCYQKSFPTDGFFAEELRRVMTDFMCQLG